MASRIVLERTLLKSLQKYHGSMLNCLGDHETLVEAIANRPGFSGHNPVAYLSIIARRPSVTALDLEEALINDRLLLRAGAFRSSLLLLSTADYAVYFRASYPMLKTVGMELLASAGITEAHLKFYEQQLIEEDFELPKSLHEICDIIFATTKSPQSMPVKRMVIRKLCDHGVLVRNLAKGWKGNDFRYMLFSQWFPEINLRPENPESARTETIRRYLRCYGPATIEDICWWTGQTELQVRRSISHLRRDAVRFPVEGYKDDLIGLKESIEFLRAPVQESMGIQFLPPFDPYPLGWFNKIRVADKAWQPWIFDVFGNATSVIVDGGRIIGVWQFRDNNMHSLEFHVFEPYAGKRMEVFLQAESFAATLASLSGSLSVNVLEWPLPTPLTQREPGAFLWPLGRESPFRAPKSTLSPSSMERRTANTFRSTYLDSKHVVLPTDDRQSLFGVE